eukprot:2006231-Pleurochrysis_carterae.AAC.1
MTYQTAKGFAKGNQPETENEFHHKRAANCATAHAWPLTLGSPYRWSALARTLVGAATAISI